VEKDVTERGLATPVLIIAYRRVQTTRKVLDAVRLAQPKRLYVALNACRLGNQTEQAQCDEVRKLFESIDWPCEVQQLVRIEHLSARESISGAITWFFETEKHGIILEDDCVPSQGFFRFAEELLERYADDKRIGMISGNNFQFGRRRGLASYYFSRYSHIWGWATWRDRWISRDATMKAWPENSKQLLNELKSPLQRLYWNWIFQRTYLGLVDTWDYQWLFSNWINNRLTILPQVNLVANVGFDQLAHNTHNISPAANIEAKDLSFPLIHPEVFLSNRAADDYTFNKIYVPPAVATPRVVWVIITKALVKVSKLIMNR